MKQAVLSNPITKYLPNYFNDKCLAVINPDLEDVYSYRKKHGTTESTIEPNN